MNATENNNSAAKDDNMGLTTGDTVELNGNIYRLTGEHCNGWWHTVCLSDENATYALLRDSGMVRVSA
tara:strand:- start:481 stop:684 length:204 start_codon:yes stop_codon:yes gene_type:complete